MKEKYYIVLNSTFSYIIAFLVTTIIHEFAHALTGKVFNSAPVMHHNFVTHFNFQILELHEKVLINIAGPLFSLIQGLLCGWLFLRTRRRGLFQLSLLWLSVLGLFNFFGYLFVAPIFVKGDIGEVYLLVDTPILQQIIISLFAAAVLLFVAYKLTVPFISFSYKQKWVEKGPDRKSFSLHTLIIPWLLGSIIVSILYLPIIALISIVYPIMSGFVFIFPWQNANRAENFVLSQNENSGKFSIQLTFALITLVLLFKVVLSAGIEF